MIFRILWVFFICSGSSGHQYILCGVWCQSVDGKGEADNSAAIFHWLPFEVCQYGGDAYSCPRWCHLHELCSSGLYVLQFFLMSLQVRFPNSGAVLQDRVDQREVCLLWLSDDSGWYLSTVIWMPRYFALLTWLRTWQLSEYMGLSSVCPYFIRMTSHLDTLTCIPHLTANLFQLL